MCAFVVIALYFPLIRCNCVMVLVAVIHPFSAPSQLTLLPPSLAIRSCPKPKSFQLRSAYYLFPITHVTLCYVQFQMRYEITLVDDKKVCLFMKRILIQLDI